MERRTALVGALVGGREVGTVEVLQEGEQFLLPVDELRSLLHVVFVRRGETASFATPLGNVAVDEQGLELVDGALYVDSDYLAERIATPISFDRGRYALEFDLPWRLLASETSVPSSEPLVPDIRAPGSTLSGLGGRLNHTRTGESSNLSGDVRLEGRVARGLWRVRFEDSETTPFQAREYQWYTRHNRTSYLAGRQRLQLHSSLAGFDMAGFQVAWTNREHGRGTLRWDGNAMLAHRGRPVETFRGSAPAGSFVQLRVEGRVVSTQQVGFSGFYEFHDVPLPSRQTAEIEVLVFDRHNRRVPVEARRFRFTASDLLLRAGEVIHTGGVGRAGTFTEGFFDGPPEAHSSGGAFYQWRQGVSSRLTTEAAVQYAGESLQTFAGMVTRLAGSWFLGLGVSNTSGATGFSTNLEGYGQRWRLFARAFSRPADFELIGEGFDREEQAVELFHDTLPRLTLGLTARSRDDGFEETRYVLPSAMWRPHHRFYLDMRPDIYGDYQGSALWSMNDETRIRLFVAETSNLEVTHDVTELYQVGFDTAFGGGFGTRHTLTATRLARTLRAWSFKGGLVHADGEMGYLLAANTPVFPGLHVQMEYQSIPQHSFAGEDLGRFLLSISTDLSHVGGRFMPARSTRGVSERGSVAGRIVVDPAFAEYVEDQPWARRFNDVRILVDRRVRDTTDPGGRFFVGNLPPGHYVVELDPEHLPIQLTPRRTRFVVEVQSGAVTRVDFRVRPELGLAGRVRYPSGDPAVGVTVELLDATGARVAGVRTDRFGLYRIDGIPPGPYSLRATRDGSDGANVSSRRAVSLTGDFLFDQDLRLELEVPSPEPLGNIWDQGLLP